MAELVGATNELPEVVGSSFKQHLLVFDRIACPTVVPLLKEMEEKEERGGGADDWLQELTRDLPWLLREGLVFSPDWEPPQKYGDYDEELLDQYIAQHTDINVMMVEFLTDKEARELAVHLRQQQLNAVPILCGWSKFPHDATDKSDVIQLVINDLPIPGDNHSLQDVLEFRKEAHELGLIQGLRTWVNEMASGKLTQAEVSDKLEDLVSRYERTLKLEKMSRSTGVVETLVVSPAEIAESLVKFQWSKIAKKLFEVKHKQIDLMKAEMTLPGREVAYIVKARDRFGPK
jgi:hypothetical protein